MITFELENLNLPLRIILNGLPRPEAISGVRPVDVILQETDHYEHDGDGGDTKESFVPRE